MTARSWVLVAATGSGWSALALAALSSSAPAWWAVVAGVAGLGAWHWRTQWLAAAFVVGVAVLLLYSGSVTAGALCGVLLLVSVVLTDVAEDSYEARIKTVLRALRPLVPGLLAAGAAAVAGVLALVWAVQTGPERGLVLAAPLVLLAACLIALGIDSRRAFWMWLGTPRRHDRRVASSRRDDPR